MTTYNQLFQIICTHYLTLCFLLSFAHGFFLLFTLFNPFNMFSYCFHLHPLHPDAVLITFFHAIFTITEQTLPPFCLLEPDRGTGNTEEMVWYYNREAGTCHNFTYTGNDGNDNDRNYNRFSSYSTCKKACGHSGNLYCKHHYMHIKLLARDTKYESTQWSSDR